MQDLLLMTKSLNDQNKKYWQEKVRAIKNEGIQCLHEKLRASGDGAAKQEDFIRNLSKV